MHTFCLRCIYVVSEGQAADGALSNIIVLHAIGQFVKNAFPECRVTQTHFLYAQAFKDGFQNRNTGGQDRFSVLIDTLDVFGLTSLDQGLTGFLEYCRSDGAIEAAMMAFPELGNRFDAARATPEQLASRYCRIVCR